jgi:preprotein translocase subunit SecG
MIQSSTAIIKSLFLEPFKGGGGGGGGGGGRGGSRRKNKDAQNPRSMTAVFIFFIIIYSLAFLFSFLRK